MCRKYLNQNKYALKNITNWVRYKQLLIYPDDLSAVVIDNIVENFIMSIHQELRLLSNQFSYLPVHCLVRILYQIPLLYKLLFCYHAISDVYGLLCLRKISTSVDNMLLKRLVMTFLPGNRLNCCCNLSVLEDLWCILHDELKAD